MKLKVLKEFRDVHTKKIHNEGEIMEDVSKERYLEIIAVDETLVEIVEESTKEAAVEKPKKGRKAKEKVEEK